MATHLIRSIGALVICTLVGLPALGRAEDVQDHFQASYNLEAVGKPVQALQALEQIPAAARNTYVFHLRRGWLRQQIGQFAPAVTSYRQAAQRAPEAVEPLAYLLGPLTAEQRWREVADTAAQILSRAPGHAKATASLAFAYYNLGRYADAEGVYRRACAAYPADPDMHAGLGWSLLRRGQYREAQTVFYGVLAFAPEHESTRAGLLALQPVQAHHRSK